MGKTVYIVEDERLIAEILAHYIAQNLGYPVKVFGDTKIAAAAMDIKAPMLVITDLFFHKVNAGIPFLQAFVSRFPNTKFLVLTGHSDASLIWSAVRAGAHGIIHKLSSGLTVCEAAEAVLAGQAFFCQETSRIMAESGGGQRPSPIFLTAREQQVFDMIGQGMRVKEIAATLHTSDKTVYKHISSLAQKFNVSGLDGVMRVAIKRDSTPPISANGE